MSTEAEEINKIRKGLTKVIVGYYAPKSTRWRRNHTDVGQWYWIWEINGGKLF